MVLITVGELEIPRSLAFEVSKQEVVRPQVVATGFWIGVCLGVIQAVVLAALLPIYLPADKIHLLPASRWFMVYLPAGYITFALTGIDQGRGRFGRFSFFQTLPAILYVAAILVAWMTGHISPTTFAVGVLSASVSTAIARTAGEWKVISNTMPDWVTARRLLKRGLGYYLPVLAGFLLARFDMFLVVRLVPAEGIGLYSVAQAIALGQIGAVSPFLQVGFSAVAAEAEPDQGLLILSRHFRLAQIVAIGVGMAAAAATPWGIRLFFGPKFTSATTATFLLIGATAFWGMEQVLEQGLRAASHTRPGILSNLIGFAVLAGVGIPACEQKGISGLAAAVLLSQATNLAILIAFCVLALRMPARALWAFDSSTLRDFGSAAGAFLRACAKA
jgi:O-antigen/teichoic acid export membrane protein